MIGLDSPLDIATALRLTRRRLANAGCDEARLEARLLVQAATQLDWASQLAWPQLALTSAQATELRRLVSRRVRREPLAYVVGHTEFRTLPLQVDRRVLVPRPETELLAQVGIDRCRSGDLCIDVGTGSGAIVLSVAAERPDVSAVGIDLSADALAVAQANARLLGLSSRVGLVQADLLSSVDPAGHVVLANLPYVGEDDLRRAQPELAFEPRLALAGGADGLDVYRRLFASLDAARPPRIVAIELGAGQAAAAARVAASALAGCHVELIRDYAGIERVLVATT